MVSPYNQSGILSKLTHKPPHTSNPTVKIIRSVVHPHLPETHRSLGENSKFELLQNFSTLSVLMKRCQLLEIMILCNFFLLKTTYISLENA